MACFKEGDEILKMLMNFMAFMPLVEVTMKRMEKCSPDVQAKMMEYFSAEETNKKLFAE